MKIRSQVGMVLNLDKCIGCHTCSVTCKNVWTSREGMEYAWFNNVESKPGVGYPANWEDQDQWKGGWIRKINGKIEPKMGGKVGVLSKLFNNPDMPSIDDYYEPFTFDYEHLQNAKESKHQPIARPRSLITGKRMDKIENGPNWEEILGGEYSKRSKDYNLNAFGFEQKQKEIVGEFENTFMMYLPRLCEHCLNPACVATCPSGSIYKREEDGIVLIDQDKCRGWRMCLTGCPYKKIYFNWKSGKSEKCIFCYPRIEAGQPTVCSETCVGRIRYLGVMLYDADKVEQAASTEKVTDLYQEQLDVFLDPNDPTVIKEALAQGVPMSTIEAAQKSPVYKMAVDWKLALPLHPEYRTLPMVWYVPPLSPIQAVTDAGVLDGDGILPEIERLRIPVKYLANLLTAGDEKPVLSALKRMLAMRHYKRAETVDGVIDTSALEEAGLTEAQAKEMYRYLAIANYEDRFVIPASHREMAKESFPGALDDTGAYAQKSSCGFSFGDGCHGGGSENKFNLFDSKRIDAINIDPKTAPQNSVQFIDASDVNNKGAK
ncbi:nitrate reductase subunit beta [Vibrio sp. S17_S38]|uniref:nitrate reductase subunit beta n=1 Tax=Vibrio sp. S17_S38 TaxID=2720229 RepID=UPI001680770B|nr:nitrate reductase subunit beta [Vibrio sp. S17_S38]MBD1572560.1 nitrate reductase subunit beta [Vibrio sp. S17_S38]